MNYGEVMTEKEYKKILKDELIEYRESLNLSKDITFGVEIEYENIPVDNLSYFLEELRDYNNNFLHWKNKREIDIEEINNLNEEMNGEINSPILIDSIDTWQNLREILNLLNSNSAIITERCGGHVNIGAHILGGNSEYWRNFILLWILYEKEIYKFSSGEYVKVRNRNDNIINNSSNILKRDIESILKLDDSVSDYLNNCAYRLFTKKYDISFQDINDIIFKRNNKIEFRVPNGSLNEEIWQNYINFFTKFLIACKKELNIDKILYKLKNDEHNAVELDNYIFDDEIDKNYFLIQTLKANKVYKKILPSHIKYINNNKILV